MNILYFPHETFHVLVDIIFPKLNLVSNTNILIRKYHFLKFHKSAENFYAVKFYVSLAETFHQAC